jgi:hypothetical protein
LHKGAQKIRTGSKVKTTSIIKTIVKALIITSLKAFFIFTLTIIVNGLLNEKTSHQTTCEPQTSVPMVLRAVSMVLWAVSMNVMMSMAASVPVVGAMLTMVLRQDMLNVVVRRAMSTVVVRRAVPTVMVRRAVPTMVGGARAASTMAVTVTMIMTQAVMAAQQTAQHSQRWQQAATG